MTRTTKAQRVALKRVFDRGPVYPQTRDHKLRLVRKSDTPLTYRQFRSTVQSAFCGDGAVLVPWAGMWLGIEPDGYTHS
jgi:hypothetical protein